MSEALATLTNRLATGPFHLAVVRSENDLAAGRPPAAARDAFGFESRAPVPPPDHPPAGENHFVIEGVIR